MTRVQVALLMQLPDLLNSLGLSLYCPNCQRLGLKDGVRGDNPRADGSIVLDCGCTDRIYHPVH